MPALGALNILWATAIWAQFRLTPTLVRTADRLSQEKVALAHLDAGAHLWECLKSPVLRATIPAAIAAPALLSASVGWIMGTDDQDRISQVLFLALFLICFGGCALAISAGGLLSLFHWLYRSSRPRWLIPFYPFFFSLLLVGIPLATCVLDEWLENYLPYPDTAIMSVSGPIILAFTLWFAYDQWRRCCSVYQAFD
jgi:hypothetical protein